jgi:hypothetical protein
VALQSRRGLETLAFVEVVADGSAYAAVGDASDEVGQLLSRLSLIV